MSESPIGEVTIRLKDGEHTIRYTTNTWIRLEQAVAQAYPSVPIWSLLAQQNLFAIRQAILVGLRQRNLSAEDLGKKMLPGQGAAYANAIAQAAQAAGLLSLGDDDDQGEAPGSQGEEE